MRSIYDACGMVGLNGLHVHWVDTSGYVSTLAIPGWSDTTSIGGCYSLCVGSERCPLPRRCGSTFLFRARLGSRHLCQNCLGGITSHGGSGLIGTLSPLRVSDRRRSAQVGTASFGLRSTCHDRQPSGRSPRLLWTLGAALVLSVPRGGSLGSAAWFSPLAARPAREQPASFATDSVSTQNFSSRALTMAASSQPLLVMERGNIVRTLARQAGAVEPAWEGKSDTKLHQVEKSLEQRLQTASRATTR